jgi:aspartyl/asparaginyl-tRNA synthetase
MHQTSGIPMKRLDGWLLSKKQEKRRFIGNIFHNGEKIPFIFETEKITKEQAGTFERLMPWSVIRFFGEKKPAFFVVRKFEMVNPATRELPFNPIEKNSASLNTRLDYRYIDLRSKKNQNIFHIRRKLISLFREYFNKNGYHELVSPKLVLAGLESNIAPFTINYFGQNAYLSKGPQTYKTMLLAAGWNRVFEIGPVFRVEKKFTPRHVAEFTAIDFDFAFTNSEFDVMDEEEKALRFVLNRLSKRCKEEFRGLGIRLKKVGTIPRMENRVAKKILAKKGKFLEPNDSFDTEAEQLLGEYALKKFGSELLFIHNYPWSDRFFYYQKSESDLIGSKSFDVLFRGSEIGTSAQKEHRKNTLLKQAVEKGLDLKKLRSYFKLFDYGMPTYGGGGIGVDRFLQKIVSATDVREVIQFPRDPKRLTP